MKNITITLEEEVARWARVRAAECETSVSRLVGEMLRAKMMEEQAYGTGTQVYLFRSPKQLKEPDQVYPSRRELHEL